MKRRYDGILFALAYFRGDLLPRELQVVQSGSSSQGSDSKMDRTGLVGAVGRVAADTVAIVEVERFVQVAGRAALVEGSQRN